MPLTDWALHWYLSLSLPFRLPNGCVGVGSRGQTCWSPTCARLLIKYRKSPAVVPPLSNSHLRRPPGDMGHTIKASSRPECKHPPPDCVQMRRKCHKGFALFVWFSLICDIIFFVQVHVVLAGNRMRFLCGCISSSSFPFPQEKEGVEAVSVGAILSDYQRVRVENM